MSTYKYPVLLQGIFWILASFIMSQCDSPEKPPATPTPPQPSIHSLIFIDKTVSFDMSDGYGLKKYEQIIKQVVQENVHQKDDQVEVYFIHENTAQAKVFSTKAKASLGDTTQMNPTDVERIKNDYTMALKKDKLRMVKKCLQALSEVNESDTKTQTDIWATIPIIDKKNNKKEENALLKVYYFSDMVESMQGAEKRDFHVSPPSSAEQAREWATKDAQNFSNVDIEAAEVYYILPFSPLSSTEENNPQVMVYWERLFTALEIEEINEITIEE